MDNVQNCEGYINMPSAQTYRASVSDALPTHIYQQQRDVLWSLPLKFIL
jgi:hypothetical protein